MNLSKHRTEASYAHSWSDARDSSKARKHKQYAINRFHRAVRRSQRKVITEQLEAVRTETPVFIGRTYHSDCSLLND